MTRFTPRLAVLLTVLILGAFAYSAEPFTLGPVIKLGTSTHAAMPTLSDGGGIQGGIIFNLDAGAVYVNNGTSWAEVGAGSSSGSYWYDAGAGYIYAQETLKNPDAGAVFIRSSNPPNHSTMTDGLVIGHTTQPEGVNLSPMLSFVGNPASPYESNRMGAFFGSQATSGSVQAGLTIWGAGSINFQVGSIGATPGRAASQLGYWSSSGLTLHYKAASGADAFKFDTAGARAHLGTGTNDYLYSDGTGVVTPSYFTPGSFADAGLPTPSATTRGAWVWNSSQAAPHYSDGSKWLQLPGFTMTGVATGGAMNNTTTLGASYASGHAQVSNLTCVWGGGTGGTTGVVLELSAGATAGSGLCSCAIGDCAGTVGVARCACAASITAGSTVIMQYRTVLLDGGAGADCTTNPTSMICNTN